MTASHQYQLRKKPTVPVDVLLSARETFVDIGRVECLV